MTISASRLKALEKRVKQHVKGSTTLKPVPTDWEKFVNLCTIRSGGSMVRFTPYEYQKILIKLRRQFNNIVVVKSRQLGTTQAIASDDLLSACTNPASSSVFFMRNADDVGSLSRRIKQMLSGLSEYVLPANDSVGYIKIKNCGDIYIKNSSKEGIRSLDSVTSQTYDEAAFCPNIEQIYGASSASSALVGDKVSKLIISTPSAKMGWYWNKLSENNNDDIELICKQVAEGKLYKHFPGFYYFVDNIGTLKVVLHWRCHPVYTKIDKEFPGGYLAYRMKQDNCSEEVALREYDLRFIDSAVAVFTSEIVKANATGTWEDYRDSEAIYFGGLDTSTTGNDYTCFTLLKYKDRKFSKVHLYRKKQQTSQYHIYQISEILSKYRPYAVGIEVTGGVGQLYLEQLSKQFKDIKFEAIRTTGDSKPVMISSLQLALEKCELQYPSNSPLVEELLSFRREGNKLEASRGKHDDTVMSTAFALVTGEKYNNSTWSFNDVPRF